MAIGTPQPHEQRSLFGEILDWMLAPLLLVWPMSIVLTWAVAQNIAGRPYDRALGEMAHLVSKQVVVQAQRDGSSRAELVLSPAAADLLRSDETDVVFYQVLGLRGELVSGDRTLPLPADTERGPTGEVRFRDDVVGAEPVRVAYVWVNVGGDTAPPLVQVAETLDKRSRLATEIIKGVILPQFVILPVAVLLVWLALARGFAPLAELQQRIRRRDSGDLSPIDERLAPEEVAPLVRAINDLLGRLDQSIGTQKQFLADAAHQLKTPLAGLRMQAELAQREIDAGQMTPQQLRTSLQHIARSSQSAAHMVNQLLAMARAEDREHAAQRRSVNLGRLASEAVRDFVPRALEKRIDLGYEGPDHGAVKAGAARPLSVVGHPLLLRELVRNLVDNALLYTPSGGTVTVRVVDDPFGQVVVLQVEDNGPGIAAEDRDKVFRPFFRTLGTDVDGSGLGLAIVRQIAADHDAQLSLEDTDPRLRTTEPPPGMPGPGARFTIRFAAVPNGRATEAPVTQAGQAD